MRSTNIQNRKKDLYLECVKRFPLKSIKTQAGHDLALAHLTELAANSPADQGAIEYLDTLAQLIDDYERGAGLKLDLSHLTPIDALRHLMEVHGLTVTAMGKLIGSQGTLSDVLAGRRELSKAHVRTLAEHFGISPAVLL